MGPLDIVILLPIVVLFAFLLILFGKVLSGCNAQKDNAEKHE